jgi:hypothetical protein
MTIFIPHINILKTICRDIDKIDKEKPFILGAKEYYKVDPFCFSNDGNVVTALNNKQLENFNTYQSSVITDTETIFHILENDFDITCQDQDVIAMVTVFNGDCDEYIGERVVIDKMIEYLDNLKSICADIKKTKLND